jgi:hypothetical protein
MSQDMDNGIMNCIGGPALLEPNIRSKVFAMMIGKIIAAITSTPRALKQSPERGET